MSGWFGFFAPKGTPKDVIAKLNGAMTQALADPAVQGASSPSSASTSRRASSRRRKGSPRSRRPRSRSGGRSSRPPTSRANRRSIDKRLLTAMRTVARRSAGRIAVACGAQAQTYPSRADHASIVPFAAGGPTDAIARIFGRADAARRSARPSWSRTSTGAGRHASASAAVARAAPDGYTISIGHCGTHVVNGAIYPLHVRPAQGLRADLADRRAIRS